MSRARERCKEREREGGRARPTSLRFDATRQSSVNRGNSVAPYVLRAPVSDPGNHGGDTFDDTEIEIVGLIRLPREAG